MHKKLYMLSKSGISNSGTADKGIRNNIGTNYGKKYPFAHLFPGDDYGISRKDIDNKPGSSGKGSDPDGGLVKCIPTFNNKDGVEGYSQGYTHYMKAYEPNPITDEPQPETAEVTAPSGKTIRITVSVGKIVDTEDGTSAITVITRQCGITQEKLPIALEKGMALRIADGVRLKVTGFDKDIEGRYVQIEIIVDGGPKREKEKKIPMLELEYSAPQENKKGERPLKIGTCTCIPGGGPSIEIK